MFFVANAQFSSINGASIEKITVQCPNKSNISLVAGPSTTIKSIKSQLQLLLNIPANEQSIRLETGRDLNDSNTLESLDLNDNVKFIMERVENNRKLDTIKVKFDDGHVDTLTIEPTSTVSMLKELLNSIEHIPLEQQVLYYGEKILLDTRTIENYSIPDEAFLSLQKRNGQNEDGLKIVQVLTHIGDKDKRILISVNPMETTRMVRFKLENILRTKLKYGLKFNDLILSDSRTLSSYNIPNKAILTAY